MTKSADIYIFMLKYQINKFIRMYMKFSSKGEFALLLPPKTAFQIDLIKAFRKKSDNGNKLKIWSLTFRGNNFYEDLFPSIHITTNMGGGHQSLKI